MRETRNAQANVFDFYSEHDKGKQLKALSDVLDQHPGILTLIEQDFSKHDVASTGARGLSLESIFRCLILKLMLGSATESSSSPSVIRRPIAALLDYEVLSHRAVLPCKRHYDG